MSEQPVEPAAGADLRAPLDDAEALQLLRDGEIDLEGRLLDASQRDAGRHRSAPATLAGECVYKPVAGERPLWDFPDGTLAGREISAFLVSEATGWRVVPADGAARRARSGRAWCSCGSTATTTSTSPAFVRRDDPALRRMAVFDAVVNNADRKGGHIIPMPDGHVYGVDHGICFSVDPKLRTLLWRWAGKPLPDEAVEVLERLGDELRGDLGEQLHEHLTRREVRAHPAAGGRAAAHRAAPRAQRRLARAALAALLSESRTRLLSARRPRRGSVALSAARARMPAMPHRSRLSILLLDLPPEHHAAGSAFWAGATGRPAEPDPADDDWASLGSFADGFHVEIQRTGEGTPPRWHVDIESDDVEAEVARLEALGATRHRYMEPAASGRCSTRPGWCSASSASRPARSSSATR